MNEYVDVIITTVLVTVAARHTKKTLKRLSAARNSMVRSTFKSMNASSTENPSPLDSSLRCSFLRISRPVKYLLPVLSLGLLMLPPLPVDKLWLLAFGCSLLTISFFMVFDAFILLLLLIEVLADRATLRMK